MRVSLIAARGGSKGIPGKNLIKFCGKPLITWTLDLAKKVSDKVLVSSDSPEILNLSEKHGCKGILRPKEISGDYASSESAWIHSLYSENINSSETIIAFQATSPLRNIEIVKKAIKKFENSAYDSLFSSRNTDAMHLWDTTQEGNLRTVNFDNNNRKMRQNKSACISQENGSFYIFTAQNFLSSGIRLHGKITQFEMPVLMSFEIDEKDDISLLESIYNNNKASFFTP